MKIINPEAHILFNEGVTPYQFIEIIGRTCYKSLDKITEDSSVKFVSNLCGRKHYAMLEHYWVHIRYSNITIDEFNSDFTRVANTILKTLGGIHDVDKYIHVTSYNHIYLSAPLRFFLELDNIIYDYPSYDIVAETMFVVAKQFPEIISPSKYYCNHPRAVMMGEYDFCVSLAHDLIRWGNHNHVVSEVMKHRTHTVLFVCDRGVSHELVRHRPASFAQESTRYCNYAIDRFGNEITVIKPCFYQEYSEEYDLWKAAMENAEYKYFQLLNAGSTPQEARSVLPNSLKTELIITANEVEWQHIIDLRYLGTTGAPHPQMKEVMSLIVPTLIESSDRRLHA